MFQPNTDRCRDFEERAINAAVIFSLLKQREEKVPERDMRVKVSDIERQFNRAISDKDIRRRIRRKVVLPVRPPGQRRRAGDPRGRRRGRVRTEPLVPLRGRSHDPPHVPRRGGGGVRQHARGEGETGARPRPRGGGAHPKARGDVDDADAERVPGCAARPPPRRSARGFRTSSSCSLCSPGRRRRSFWRRSAVGRCCTSTRRGGCARRRGSITTTCGGGRRRTPTRRRSPRSSPGRSRARTPTCGS